MGAAGQGSTADNRRSLLDDWGHDNGWGGSWNNGWNSGWNSGGNGRGGGSGGGTGNATNYGHCTDANWCWGFCAGAPAQLPFMRTAAGRMLGRHRLCRSRLRVESLSPALSTSTRQC